MVHARFAYFSFSPPFALLKVKQGKMIFIRVCNAFYERSKPRGVKLRAQKN
jgi:hypothetical protein